MATSIAIANLSGGLCAKFQLATRLSSCIRLKVCSVDGLQQHVPSVPTRTIWAGPIYGTPKKQQTPSLDRKPKHPANVFIVYLQQVQDRIQKENPGASRKQVVAIASQWWKNVDPETKSQLTMRRKEMFEKYKEDMKHYVDNMTPEEMRLEETVKQQKITKKLKTARRELGMPKLPASAFCCFMADQYAHYAGEEPVTRVFKKLRDDWNRLSDKEKEKYKEQSAQRSSVYKEEMERWEKEMMEMGRFDVIRKSTLLHLASVNNPKRAGSKKEDTEL